MTEVKDRIIRVITILLLVSAGIVRTVSLPQSNHDMAVYNIPWYQTIAKLGILNALGTSFTNYNPPYTYFLSLATLTQKFILPLIAIKLIPTFFDILSALCIYKIVKLKYSCATIPLLASAVYFSAPSKALNSSYWGQVDSLYTFFLLLCLYYLLVNKPFVSLVAFGLSFSIKAQAIFFLPFLAILMFQKRINIKQALIIPFAYLAAVSPVIFLGRPMLDTFLVYVNQSGSFNKLSMNAPNFYVFLSNNWYSTFALIGASTAILIISYWIYISVKTSEILDQKSIVLYSLIALTITPFLLPKMHDRYFYPADVFSIVLAFYQPGLWFVAVLYQIISMFSTSVFLFNTDPILINIASFINAVAIAVLLKAQKNSKVQVEENPKSAILLSWTHFAFVALFTFNLCIYCLLQPFFLRLEYSMPYFSDNKNTLSKYERYEKASYLLGYLKNQRNDGYLLKPKLTNDSPVFTNNDITYLAKAKILVKYLSDIRLFSFLGLFITTLIAWTKDWLPFLKQSLVRSGRFILWGSIIAGLISIILFINLPWINLGVLPYLKSDSILGTLFPLRFWVDAMFFTIGVMTSIGATIVWAFKSPPSI